MGVFKFSWDQEEDTAPQRLEALTPPQEKSDVGMEMGKGFEDIGQLLAGAGEYAARKADLPAVAGRLRDAIKRSKANQEVRNNAMTERAQKAAAAPLLPSSGEGRPGGKTEETQSLLDDPIESVKLKSARMVPLILASAIPGSILARVGAGGVAIAGATGLTGGAFGAGDMVNTINDEIDGMSHEQLMKGSKVYRTEVENGVDPLEARDNIKEMVQDQQVPLATLINIGTNTFGPEAIIAKSLGGHAVRKGLAKGIAEGLLGGALSEGIEGGTTAYGQEATRVTQGGQDAVNWVNVAKQGIEEGAFGGLFGGTFGGLANVKAPTGRKRAGGSNAQPATQMEAVQAATPTAAEATALAGSLGQAPAPVSPPPVKSGASAKPPVGPPIIQAPGTATPPPGAKIEKTRRNYKKTTVATGTETVQAATPVGPDATQAAALQPSQPPLVRKRAQAALAEATPPTLTPPEVAPPVQAQPVQEVATPIEQAPPQVAPQVEPQLPTQVAPTQVEPAPLPPIVLGNRPVTGRVLPDLQAEARKKAEFERQSAKPDEVAGRGRRYEQTEASVLNPAEHNAWRRKMFREAQGTAPSPIAVEASKIHATRGVVLTAADKKHLQDLHRKWLEGFEAQRVETLEETKPPRGMRGQLALPGGLVVKDAKKFIREAARAAQETNAHPDVKDRVDAFGEILAAAPNRDDRDSTAFT